MGGRKKTHFVPVLDKRIEKGSTVNTDAHLSYQGISKEYAHKVIDHAEKYVDGQIHTNGCGTYVSVEPFHLFRYLDEQAFRFNNRVEMKDADRFSEVVRSTVGSRLTYKELIGALVPAFPV